MALQKIKKGALISAVLGIWVAASFSATFAFAGAPPANIPETINLNIQANHASIAGLPKDKKKVNFFSHKKHAATHLLDNSEYLIPYTNDFTCIACHQGASSPEEIINSQATIRLTTALAIKGPLKIKNYFHAICLQCHKSMEKAAKTTGPTKCKGCHNRE